MTTIPKLTLQADGTFSGSNTVEFHTVGHVDRNTRHNRLYFGNYTFLGGRYREDIELKHSWNANQSSTFDHWNEAFHIDAGNEKLVVDTLGILNDRFAADEEYGDTARLFKFKMDYSLTEVDTHVDEYAELRKWRALAKLSMDEVKLLKLEEQLVYLKLKFGGDDDEEERMGNSF